MKILRFIDKVGNVVKLTSKDYNSFKESIRLSEEPITIKKYNQEIERPLTLAELEDVTIDELVQDQSLPVMYFALNTSDIYALTSVTEFATPEEVNAYIKEAKIDDKRSGILATIFILVVAFPFIMALLSFILIILESIATACGLTTLANALTKVYDTVILIIDTGYSISDWLYYVQDSAVTVAFIILGIFFLIYGIYYSIKKMNK